MESSFKYFSIAISLIFLIYAVFLVKYFITRLIYKKSRNYFLVYWFDYIINILFFVVISLLITVYSFVSISNYFESFLNRYYPLFLATNFIIDFINSFQFLSKIRKMKLSKNYQFDTLRMNNFIRYINIMSPSEIIQHIIKILISYILTMITIIILELKIEDKYKIKFIVNMIQISVIILSTLIILFLSKRHKLFLVHKVYFKNNIVEKLYEANKIKLLSLIEHLLYKFICDLVLNIPSMINVIYWNQFDTFYFYAFYYSNAFSWFLYIFFFGTMLLNIDCCNFTLIPSIIKFLLCTKKFNIYFGHGKHRKTKILNPDNIDEFNYNSYFNDSRILNDKEEYINKLNGINDYSDDYTIFQSAFNLTLSNSDTKICISDENKLNSSESKTENDYLNSKFKILENEKMKKEKDFTPCNFFIIFKIIYLYYSINTPVYDTIKKEAEKEGLFNLPYLNSDKKKEKRKNSRGSNLSDNYKEKLSRISLLGEKQLTTSKKFTLDEIMANIQEKNLKKFFIKYLYKNLNKCESEKKIFRITTIERTETNYCSKYVDDFDNKFSLPAELTKDKSTNISNTIHSYASNSLTNTSDCFSNISNNMEFKVESLFNDTLIELFPFSEIDVNDILNSLDIGNNINLFEIFFKERNKEKDYNNYYTSDSFLFFEIYDKNYLTYNQLKSFIHFYKNYLIEKINNFSYSFLPIILGIFNITYLSYNKIIILYRNPLSFSSNISFKYWLKYIFCDDYDKMLTSTNLNEIVDLNEIEVRNNIKLDEEEYNNAIEVLNSDLNFLKSLNYGINCKLNLFILNDIYYESQQSDESVNNNIKQIKEKASFNSQGNESSSYLSKNNFINVIKNSDLLPLNDENPSQNFHFKKKYFGSEAISLLEKLYVSMVEGNNNNRYIFKIYFSELFKKKINMLSLDSSNSIINENENKENNKKLCKFLRSKLLRKINKYKNSFLENEQKIIKKMEE